MRMPHSALDVGGLIERIRACLPVTEGKLALHEPRFAEPERRYVMDCLDTGWVSYAGSYVGRFEAELARRCGAPHAVAVSSGTVALQLAVMLAGIAPGDEVLVPAFTFVATANAIVHAGAVPHFVEVEERSLGIDATRLRQHLAASARSEAGRLVNRTTGRRIAAVMPVHIFGHPVDMDPLLLLAAEHGLAVIEDAAEAIGSAYKGRACGSLAPLAALSFNGNKVVTTGGGGAVLVRDDETAHRLRHLSTTAKLPHAWRFVHDEVGYNFRMPNINAALGLGQMEALDEALAAKRRLWQRYRAAFEGCNGARVFAEADYARSNHWLIALLLETEGDAALDAVLGEVNAAGIGARPAWTPMHRLAMYGANPRMELTVTEHLASRVVNVPSSPFLAPAA
jgi:perosamine synthetase